MVWRLPKKCTFWTENYPRSARSGPRLNFVQEVQPPDYKIRKGCDRFGRSAETRNGLSSTVKCRRLPIGKTLSSMAKRRRVADAIFISSATKTLTPGGGESEVLAEDSGESHIATDDSILWTSVPTPTSNESPSREGSRMVVDLNESNFFFRHEHLPRANRMVTLEKGGGGQ